MRALLLTGLVFLVSLSQNAQESWEIYNIKNENDEQPSFEFITVADDHQVWLGGQHTDEGIYFWNQGELTSYYGGQNGLPSGNLNGMVWYDDALWCLVGSTILHKDGPYFSTIVMQTGNHLTVGEDGNLWLLDGDEILKWDGEAFDLEYTYTSYIYDLLVRSTGEIWFAAEIFLTPSIPLIRLKDGITTEFFSDDIDPASSFFSDPKITLFDNKVMVTNRYGNCYYFEDDSWHAIEINNSLNGSSNIIKALATGNDGTWFIIGGQGVYEEASKLQAVDINEVVQTHDPLISTIYLSDFEDFGEFIYVSGFDGTLLILNKNVDEIKQSATLTLNDIHCYLQANGSHSNIQAGDYKASFVLAADDSIDLAATLTAQVGVRKGGSISASGGNYQTDFIPGNASNPYQMYRSPIVKVSKTQVDYHKMHFDDATYIMPDGIANWPSNGLEALEEPLDIAPFVDHNSNGYYDPENGDYPAIRGNECVYFIASDGASSSFVTGGLPTGVELHGMIYEFDEPSNTPLHQAVFFRYTLVNRSGQALDSVRLGLFTGLNLGNSQDDYAGSKSDVFYIYNGDNDDQSAGSNNGFGMNPPALGMKALEKDWHQVQVPNGSPGPLGSDLQTDMDIWNYLTGHWKDGSPLTKGGSGYDPSNPNAQRTFYMFDGDPVTNTGWTEMSVGNSPGRRRFIASFPSVQLDQNERTSFDFVLGLGREANGNNLSNINALFSNLDDLEDFFTEQDFEEGVLATKRVPIGIDETAFKSSIQLYPNPSKGFVFLQGIDNTDRLNVYDITGRSMNYTRSGQQLFFDESVPNGVYFIQVVGSDQSNEVFRMILSR